MGLSFKNLFAARLLNKVKYFYKQKITFIKIKLLILPKLYYIL